MKITNQTIQIIAQSIWDELFKVSVQKYEAEKKKAQDAVKLSTKEKKLVTDYTTVATEINKIGKSYGHSGYYYGLISVEDAEKDLLAAKRDYIMKSYPKSNIPTINEVVTTVTLATVDVTDLKGLIEAVKSKYKVK